MDSVGGVEGHFDRAIRSKVVHDRYSASETPKCSEMSNVRFSESGTLLFASSISDQSVYVFLWNNGVLTPAPGSPYAVAGRAGRMRLSSSQNAICRDYDRRNPIFNFWTALVRSLRELNWEAHRRGETDRSSRYPRNTPEIQSRYGTARCTRGSVYSADRCTRNTQLL